VVVPIFAAAVESLAGRTGQALRLLDRAADAARAVAAAGMLSVIAREAARLLLDHGRLAEADDRLAAIGDSPELLRSDTVDLDGLRSRLAAANGAAEEAIALADRAAAAAGVARQRFEAKQHRPGVRLAMEFQARLAASGESRLAERTDG
jgi:hypothetical protein